MSALLDLFVAELAAPERPSGPVAFTLPEPPSANRWWRRAGKVMHLSSEARAYKADVEKLLTARRLQPLDGPIAITIAWHRGRKSGDLDKRIGVLLDALQGTAYVNDSQIVRITATRHDAPRNPHVDVALEGVG